jgi:hypothetical protein
MKTKYKITDMMMKELHWRDGILTVVDENDPLLRRFGQLDYIKLPEGESIDFERRQADEIWAALSGMVEMTLEDNRQESPSYGASQEVLLEGDEPVAVLVPFGVYCNLVSRWSAVMIRLTTHQDGVDLEDVLF